LKEEEGGREEGTRELRRIRLRGDRSCWQARKHTIGGSEKLGRDHIPRGLVLAFQNVNQAQDEEEGAKQNKRGKGGSSLDSSNRTLYLP